MSVTNRVSGKVMITRGSGSGSRSKGSGSSETSIRNWIEAVISATVREMIPKIFGSIMTKLIAMFDKWYAAVAPTSASITTASIVAIALPKEKEIPYREFNNTKPSEFEGVRDSSVAMRWISDVEG